MRPREPSDGDDHDRSHHEADDRRPPYPDRAELYADATTGRESPPDRRSIGCPLCPFASTNGTDVYVHLMAAHRKSAISDALLERSETTPTGRRVDGDAGADDPGGEVLSLKAFPEYGPEQGP